MRAFQAEPLGNRAQFVEEAVHRQQRDIVDRIRTPYAELVVPDDLAFLGEWREGVEQQVTRVTRSAVDEQQRRTAAARSAVPHLAPRYGNPAFRHVGRTSYAYAYSSIRSMRYPSNRKYIAAWTSLRDPSGMVRRRTCC